MGIIVCCTSQCIVPISLLGTVCSQLAYGNGLLLIILPSCLLPTKHYEWQTLYSPILSNLSHELIKRNNAAYTWRDNFSKETLQILAQHAIQSRMSRVDTALTRLLVYCQVHLVLPLDCRVFIPILEKLRKPVLANQIPDMLVREFHETSEKLVAHYISFIRYVLHLLLKTKLL